MRKLTLLRAALCMIAIMGLFSLTAGRNEAKAQPCQPCPTWWVDYDYIFPPCDIPVTVDVGWANGLISNVSSNVDGHIIYPTPGPISPANWVRVNGIMIPIGPGKIKIPYQCTTPPNPPMPNMCLEIEVRCNPCLEIKIKLVPC